MVGLEGGLGGERSSGFGTFQYFDELPEVRLLTEVPSGEDWLQIFSADRSFMYLLSLCYPRKDDISLLDEESPCWRYSLINRRGWFHSPYSGYQLKRKTLRMFGEGSILPVGIQGGIEDVSPQFWRDQKATMGARWHSIYRYGLAFPSSRL